MYSGHWLYSKCLPHANFSLFRVEAVRSCLSRSNIWTLIQRYPKRQIVDSPGCHSRYRMKKGDKQLAVRGNLVE